jgi:hypothetical protein
MRYGKALRVSHALLELTRLQCRGAGGNDCFRGGMLLYRCEQSALELKPLWGALQYPTRPGEHLREIGAHSYFISFLGVTAMEVTKLPPEQLLAPIMRRRVWFIDANLRPVSRGQCGPARADGSPAQDGYPEGVTIHIQS